MEPLLQQGRGRPNRQLDSWIAILCGLRDLDIQQKCMGSNVGERLIETAPVQWLAHRQLCLPNDAQVLFVYIDCKTPVNRSANVFRCRTRCRNTVHGLSIAVDTTGSIGSRGADFDWLDAARFTEARLLATLE